MNDLYCWTWAKRSTWRAVYVYFHATEWVAEAWLSDTGRNQRTFITAHGHTPEDALRALSTRLQRAEES